MTKKNFYLLCAILGFIIPWSVVISGITTQAPLTHMFRILFANTYSGAFTADLMFSLFVFWVFVFNETRRLGMKNAWTYMLSSAFLGLAFTFPLFLFFREREIK